ncbi:hypothetical protein INS90_01775 [Trueperella pecoris]|uniref:Uncharacterized protein n=1 Tax=Trueperella pecoris TaxID=2733571 RepID=A0A7M1R1L9_9ACTO|nr:hypothetical protein [Trueperella pecoris]QOR48053.1 hypothetical protein INS90_01775 [Trueperella pecoris]
MFNVSGVETATKKPLTIKWGELDLEDGRYVTKSALLTAIEFKLNEAPSQLTYKVAGLDSYSLKDKYGKSYTFNGDEKLYLDVESDKDHFNFEGVVTAEVVKYGKSVDEIVHQAKEVTLNYTAEFFAYEDGRLFSLGVRAADEIPVAVGEKYTSEDLTELANTIKKQPSHIRGVDLSGYTIERRREAYIDRDDNTRGTLSYDGEEFDYEVTPREAHVQMGKDGNPTVIEGANFDYIRDSFVVLRPGETAPAQVEGVDDVEVKVRYVHADTDAEILSKIVKTDLPSVRAQFWDGYSKESKASLFENTITVHGQVYVLAPRVVEESEEDGMLVFTVAVGEKLADSNDSWVYGESTIGEREANGRMLGGFRTATVR